MKIKLAYSKPVYRRPHRSFFLCGGWGEWVFVHRLRLLTIEIKVKINYKVSVFAYLSRNKRTHDILEDEDYISHIWDAFFLRFPPNTHYTTTANRTGRSIWVSPYFRHWPFTCYSWSHFLLTAVKNMKASVERLARVAWRFCRAEYWAASARANGGKAARNISHCFRPNLLVVSLPQQFCAADPLLDVYLMLKRHLFKSFLSSG